MMDSSRFQHLVCPLDHTPLRYTEPNSLTLSCSQGHSFDIGKPGYVHLLPVQHKRSKFPGDSKDMVHARRRFLENGFYRPVSDTLIDIIDQHLCNIMDANAHDKNDFALMDAGCGEGYYLRQIVSYIKTAHPTLTATLFGIDISKPAIQAAAKKDQTISWIIASNKQPPIEPERLDMITCLFGFPDFSAFKTRLKPTGKILMVDAGPHHLMALRQHLYEEVNVKPLPSLAAAHQAGFQVTDTVSLRIPMMLDQSQLADLLKMTPHFFRAPAHAKAKLALQTALQVDAHVVFRVLEQNLRLAD